MLQRRRLGLGRDVSGSRPAGVTEPRRDRPGRLGTLLALPAAILPLLPSFTCPVCIAAYAGVLSSLGLGFALDDNVQRPLIVVFLGIAVASVGWSGRRRHRKAAPVIAAGVGSLAVVAGRLLWSMPVAVYAGVALIVIGSVWNLILSRSTRAIRHPRRGGSQRGSRAHLEQESIPRPNRAASAH